jgi:uncharacterized protein
VNNWLYCVLRFCLKHKLLFVSAIAIISIYSIIQLSNIKSDSGFDHWFNITDPAYANYKDFVKTFGNDQYFILVNRDDSILTKNGLLQNKSFTTKLKRLDGVKDVISLSTVQIPHVTPIQVFFKPLIPENNYNKTVINKKLAQYKRLIDNIISSDGKTTVFHIYQTKTVNIDTLYVQLLKIIESSPHPDNYFFYNGVVLSIEATKLASNESLKYIVLAIIIITLLLLLIFRSFLLGLTPIIIAVISIIWTLCLFSLGGGNIDMLSGIIPLVILVMSTTFSIHLITKINQYKKNGASRKENIFYAYKAVFYPGLFAAITTSLAILSFSLSDIQPIKLFGVYTSIGILISFILSFLLVLFVVDSFWSTLFTKKNRICHSQFLVTDFINTLVLRNRKIKLFFFVLVTIVSFWGIKRLSAETDVYRFFKKTHKVRVAQKKVDNWFEGVLPIEVIFTLGNTSKDSIDYFMHMLTQLENKLLLNPDIENCYSLATLKESFGLRNSQSLSNKRLLYSSNSFIKTYYSRNDNKIRLTVKTRWMNNQLTQKLIQYIENDIHQVFKHNQIGYYITGVALVYGNLNSEILQNQITSILISFLIILIVLAIVFRKPPLFLSGILPNILPIINTMAIMGFLGIHLDVGTVLIASISLGIAVDDTIYFIFSYKNLRTTLSKNDALTTTVNNVSIALLRTTIVISVGFVLMIFSSYQPIIYLGLFVTLNVILAIIYDLVLLPIILYYSPT